MPALRDLLWRLRSLFRREQIEDRLDDEIRFHVEQEIEKNRRAGLAPDEARRQALIRFGGVEQVRERTRDEYRAAPIEHLVRDVRYGVRSLRRHPAFTAMAVLSLAIGIGANTVLFGVVRAILFADSGVAHPETLVNLYEAHEARGADGFDPLSYVNIEDLRRETGHVFTGIAASAIVAAPIEREGFKGMVLGEAVTGGAFALLGIEPELGRAILHEDDIARGGHPVLMLSHGYWQRAFGADPQVVGRTLRLGGRGYTVIGVAPADYRGGLPALTPAFYVPMSMMDDLMGSGVLDKRTFHSLFAKARLAPGVTMAQAEHAASLVAQNLTRVRPEGWVPGQGFSLVPTADVRILPGLDPLLRAAAWLLMVVVGLVLLLACTNLASFLLARAIDRRHEVAVRRALGASGGALFRQLLVESGLLGVAGAAAGLVVALGLLRILLSLDLPLPLGLRLDVHFGVDAKALFDWRILALTAASGVAAGGLLGLVSAVQGTRAEPGLALATGSRGSDAPGPLRWRNVLVVAQIAMSLVLLVGAGLFLRSWQQMLAVDPGFGRTPTSVLSVWMPVDRSNPVDPAGRTRRVLERFRAEPGVESAGLVWPLPLELSSSFTDFTVDGRVPPPGAESFRAQRSIIDGGFFEAAGMRLVSGRTFNDDDRRDTQPVAVISQAMARRYWPSGDALGHVLRRPDPAEADLLVVGIASDINVRALGEPPRDVVYESYAQRDSSPMYHFLVRAGAPERVSLGLSAALQEIDPALAVFQSTTMAQHLAMSRLPALMGAFLLAGFAVVAMALAAIGVYGLVRYSVARRSREIGIRMALGADARGVARLLARHGLRLVLTGGAIGVAVSLLAGRLVARMLFGVGSFDPVALGAAPVVLGAAAWLAAYLPARRASRTDPLAALRSD